MFTGLGRPFYRDLLVIRSRRVSSLAVFLRYQYTTSLHWSLTQWPAWRGLLVPVLKPPRNKESTSRPSQRLAFTFKTTRNAQLSEETWTTIHLSVESSLSQDKSKHIQTTNQKPCRGQQQTYHQNQPLIELLTCHMPPKGVNLMKAAEGSKAEVPSFGPPNLSHPFTNSFAAEGLHRRLWRCLPGTFRNEWVPQGPNHWEVIHSRR